jgi:hypothetical protein
MSARYAGTDYLTIRLAALAYAADALPDLSNVAASEDAATVGSGVEAIWYSEAHGALDLPTVEGEAVIERTWRALCRGAIAERIEAHRADRRAVGGNVDELPALCDDAECGGAIGDDGCYLDCGIAHGDPCQTCAGRGLHRPACAESEAP